MSASFAIAFRRLFHDPLAPLVPLAFMTFALLGAVALSFASLRRIAQQASRAP